MLVITYQETALLHLPTTVQEGAPLMRRCSRANLTPSLLGGAPEVEQTCFLVGNNQLTSPTPYTPYYYRPELVMLPSPTSLSCMGGDSESIRF